MYDSSLNYKTVWMDGRVRKEHRVVAERALGKRLPSKAVIHHINDDHFDNRNENLVICQDNAYHQLIHARRRVLRAGGRPGLDLICCTCQLVKPIGDFPGSYKRLCHDCTIVGSRLRMRKWRASQRETP